MPAIARQMLCLGLVFFAVAAPAFQPNALPDYVTASPSRDGIGKVYMGREISQVMGHFGSAWLERPSRLREELPDVLIASLALPSDAVVADIGAGTGYFTFRLAGVVPDGRVMAVDIQPEMLAVLDERIADLGIDNVKTVHGAIDNPNLAKDSVDAVLMVDAYHEFSHPWEMMQGIMQALRPGGRVFLVEYRGEDAAVPIKPLHKMTEAQARREMSAVGLHWEKTLDVLPTQHLMVFRKPALN